MNTETCSTKPPVQRAPVTLQGQSRRKWLFPGALAGLGFAAFFLVAVPALAATAPPLGTAAPYAVLGTNASPTVGTVTCNDTGPGTFINGDVGSTFTSITNNGCTITGAITAPVPNSVVTDFNDARAALNSLNSTCDGTIPITSTTLGPGVYCSTAGTTIGTGVTLTLSGTASDVWVFRVGTTGLGALTLTGAKVVMGGTAQACNVWWGTSAGATVTDASFVGTILSGAAATMTRGSFLGRLMATTDATLTDPAPMAGCAAPATVQVTKVSNGGVGTFSFTGTNGIANHNITTVIPGAGVAGATQTLTVAGASTLITESALPAGYALTSITCSGLPGGTATSNIGTRTVTLDAAATAAGAAIKCTFTNTRNIVSATPIPLLNRYGLAILGLLILGIGFIGFRRFG